VPIRNVDHAVIELGEWGGHPEDDKESEDARQADGAARLSLVAA
jgi:hypothetical protein